MNLRKIILLTVLLVSNLVLSACSPDTRPAEFGTQPAVILFASDREAGEHYYSMYTTGSDVKQINLGDLPAGAIADRPTWSPSLGRYIFSAAINNRGDIFSVKSDGSDLINLTNTPELFEGSVMLSPDAQKVAYILVEFETEIFVMDINGQNKINITNYGGRNGNIAWAPDGSRLYFTSNRSGTPNIYSIKPDGSDLKNISHGKGVDATFSISPDGKQIVFDSDRDGMMDIFLVGADGGEAKNITKSPSRDVEPFWSPDGKKIAYRSNQGDNSLWHLFVMNADGSSPVNLTEKNALSVSTYSWTPDSQNLLCTVQLEDQSEIFLIPIDGSEPVNLTNHPANDYGAIWVQLK